MALDELRAIFEEDQADRRGELAATLIERDRVRRARVEELIAAGALHDAQDFYRAAMVFQHGETLDHYWRTHELAKRAAELGQTGARWLAAAAYDRWLMRQGKPQRFGTQYVAHGDRCRLYDVDPATTDDERAEWGVPPQARRRSEDLIRVRPAQPSAPRRRTEPRR